MRVVALNAVAHRRRMYSPFQFGSVFVGVAGQTKSMGRGGDQLDAGDVPVDPDLVTAQAAHRNGGVDRLAFRLVVVALDALGGVSLRIERNGVNRTESTRQTDRGEAQGQHDTQNQSRSQ